MKTVTMTGADGRIYDVSKAAKKYLDNQRRYAKANVRFQELKREHGWDSRPTQNAADLRNYYADAAGTIADTVNDMIGPRKRRAFIKATEDAYGDLP